jgi:hypothetical protein
MVDMLHGHHSRPRQLCYNQAEEGTEMGALSGKQTAKSHEYSSQILAGDTWAPTSRVEKVSSVAESHN